MNRNARWMVEYGVWRTLRHGKPQGIYRTSTHIPCGRIGKSAVMAVFMGLTATFWFAAAHTGLQNFFLFMLLVECWMLLGVFQRRI